MLELLENFLKVAGAVAGGVAILMAIGLLVFQYLHRRKGDKKVWQVVESGAFSTIEEYIRYLRSQPNSWLNRQNSEFILMDPLERLLLASEMDPVSMFATRTRFALAKVTPRSLGFLSTVHEDTFLQKAKSLGYASCPLVVPLLMLVNPHLDVEYPLMIYTSGVMSEGLSYPWFFIVKKNFLTMIKWELRGLYTRNNILEPDQEVVFMLSHNNMGKID